MENKKVGLGALVSLVLRWIVFIGCIVGTWALYFVSIIGT